MEIRQNYVQYKKRKIICGKGKTKQSFKDECDINNIMKKYMKTGILPTMIKENPKYGDFSKSVDYMDSLLLCQKATEQFAGLPAKVRDRFDNDPAQFLAFAEDPKNMGEMVKMGLATKKEEAVQPTAKTETAPAAAIKG